jgi:HAD superfamily hydrolase (TIGR01509 family)
MITTLPAGPGALARRGGSRVHVVDGAKRGSRVAPLRQERSRRRRTAEPRALELDTVASRWQLALDAADRALSAAGDRSGLPPAEVNRRRRELARERALTAERLATVAAVVRVRPRPWLSPIPLTPRMLGLPATVRACLFDLDGVLTNSGALHATAWAEVFDDLLLRQAENSGWHFRPFNRDAEYHAYLEGRPRLEGIHAFLESRGIRLREGRPGDPASMDTAYGLARRKSDVLARGLRHEVSDLPDARRYLEAAGHAGLERAVISASASTSRMLEAAGLATLVEARVDAAVMRAEGLRSRPAPDVLLAACHRLGVAPAETVTFTQAPAGVAAGLAAGVLVVGIADGAQRDLLLGSGAERVVPALGSLLDRQLLDRRQ